MQARGALCMPGVVFAAVFSGALSPVPAWSEEGSAPAAIEGAVLLSAEELVATFERHPRLVMIDARLTGDRRQGYIEGSVSLPNTETDCDSLARVLPGVDHPVVFYCNGPKCRRSYAAVKRALRCGYTRIYWFRGGFAEWKAKGYPYLNE